MLYLGKKDSILASLSSNLSPYEGQLFNFQFKILFLGLLKSESLETESPQVWQTRFTA